MNPSEHEAGRWIKSRLEAAGVVGPDALATEAYLDVIPGEAQLPAVRFNVQTRSDTRTNAQHIAVSTWTFLVVCAVEGHEVAVAAAVAAAIDEALHMQHGETDSIKVLACTRNGTHGSTPYENGHQYRLAGATYEVVGQAVS